ncbi:MAG TPA: DNA-processing protein DprA [Clostridia bacterium]|nr:DNA-processing protein DprA [Clostridia bacterium]
MEYSEQEQILIWLSSIEGIGPKRYYGLISLYPDPFELWEELNPNNPALNILGDKVKRLVLENKSKDSINRLFEKLESKKVQAVSISSYAYPQLLREIVDAPPVLFVKGDVSLLSQRCISIVGSRRCTRYGREAAAYFARSLAAEGVVVVSGMARGVDSEAHKGALEVDGGRTMAVLGCGVDMVYPPEHFKLYEEIIARGAVVSDYPLGTPPLAQHFPARNRIISGLSESTILVEADERSGALITVDYAVEQGREVYCVPGSIFAQTSRSPNRLIKMGANLAADVADVLGNGYNSKDTLFSNARKPVQLDINEQKIIDILQEGETGAEELIIRLGLDASETQSILALMELRGIIKKLPGGAYCIEGSEYC